VRMDVVAVVGSLIGKFHREAESEVSLGADLLQALELLHPGNTLQHQRVAEESRLRFGAGCMLERKGDGVADHHSAPTASFAAMAAMLTIPRLVTDGARICAGARVPIRI